MSLNIVAAANPLKLPEEALLVILAVLIILFCLFKVRLFWAGFFIVVMVFWFNKQSRERARLDASASTDATGKRQGSVSIWANVPGIATFGGVAVMLVDMIAAFPSASVAAFDFTVSASKNIVGYSAQQSALIQEYKDTYDHPRKPIRVASEDDLQPKSPSRSQNKDDFAPPSKTPNKDDLMRSLFGSSIIDPNREERTKLEDMVREQSKQHKLDLRWVALLGEFREADRNHNPFSRYFYD